MIQKHFIEVNGRPIARVTFILPNCTWASNVYLVGDFNDWNISSHPLEHTQERTWMITVDLELNRSYQFRYRRDGAWINDGQADAYVHNRYGSDNFIVITDPDFKPHLDEKKLSSALL